MLSIHYLLAHNAVGKNSLTSNLILLSLQKKKKKKMEAYGTNYSLDFSLCHFVCK